MSLYGALYSGVSGLKAQSTKIGVISDNISNVNTVGYKGGSGLFQSLVTGTASTSTYSPGGVLGGNRQLVSKQGLLQSTDSATDIAISGNGFFVVNQAADQSGSVLYSRAGSFRQDSTGNFRNAAGFFLQAWPLDREGRLPGEPGNLNTTSSANLSSLRTVNVQNLTGVAASTSSVSIGANLNSAQTAYAGAAVVAAMDELHRVNAENKAKDIIIPDDPSSPVNSIQRGDKMIVSTGAGLSYTYRYGGFTYGRNVSDSSAGDNGLGLLSSPTTLSASSTLLASPFSATNGSDIVTVTQANHGLADGDSVTLAGSLAAVAGIPANDFNNTFVVDVVDEDTYTIRVATDATSTATGGTTGITSTAAMFSVTDDSSTIRVRQVGHGLATGAVVTLSGNTDAIAGIPASELNDSFVVTVTDDDHFTLTVTTDAASDTLLATPFSVTNLSDTVTVTHASHGLSSGDIVKLAGNAVAVGGIPAGDFNGNFVVTVTGANTYTIRTASAATSTTTGGTTGVTALDFNGGAGTVSSITRPFVGNILDATSATQPFLGTTGISTFTPDALTFTITTVTAGTVTFTYTSASPNPQLGQFNNLNNLATAISAVNGLSARVSGNQIYISPTDANEAMTITNGSTVGISGPPVLGGIDWVRELGLSSLSVGVDRFSTLEGLAALINDSPGVSATIENALSDATLSINVDDPLDTITVSDRPVNTTAIAASEFIDDPIATVNGSRVVTISHNAAHGLTTGDIITLDGLPAGSYSGIDESYFNDQQFTITVTSPTTYTITLPVGVEATATANVGGSGNLTALPPTNAGSLVAELGLVDSLSGGAFTVEQTTGAQGPAYDPTDSTKNMASGTIAAQFSRPMRVFDALGTGHDLSMSFIKIGVNTWAVEVFALPESDVTTSLPDGQLTYGTITFNGDGSLRSVSSLLSSDVDITWTNGAAASTVAFNWGTAGQPFGTDNAVAIGLTDGLSQFNSAYRVNFVNQNGAPVGELSGVAIDENGNVIASYSNGETQSLFRIPLADFANPDQLRSISGNVFGETADSGAVNLSQAGTSGVGKVAASSLEASNVELADQLTDMIVAQRAYQANTKVIQTSDSLLDELNRILQ